MPSNSAILKKIKEATPAFKRAGLPVGVNVVIMPPLDRQFLIPGMKKDGTVINAEKVKDWQDGKIGVKLIPTLSSKTSVSADCGKSKNAAKYEAPDGPATGSTCLLQYSNTEILSDAGLWAIPHITMGHELIHCVHALYGQSKWDDRAEEYFTVGIKGYENAAFTENKLREEGGFKKREKYFKDD